MLQLFLEIMMMILIMIDNESDIIDGHNHHDNLQELFYSWRTLLLLLFKFKMMILIMIHNESDIIDDQNHHDIF